VKLKKEGVHVGVAVCEMMDPLYSSLFKGVKIYIHTYIHWFIRN